MAIGKQFHSVALVEPQSGMERRIAAIWQEVLGLDSVGTNDNFFDLGGHSPPRTRVFAPWGR